MELMPYHPELDGASVDDVRGLRVPTIGWFSSTGLNADWRAELPQMTAPKLTMRELRVEDAPSLFAQLTTEEVARFISPPPASVEGFEKFIRWTHRERKAGRHACFAVVPEGQTTAVGMFQVRMLDAEPMTAEWGFALGSSYWGTGLFMASARLVLDFAFDVMGIQKLEAYACVANGRGTGALRKLGAVWERLLPGAFERRGERLDQVVWTLFPEHRRFRTSPVSRMVH